MVVRKKMNEWMKEGKKNYFLVIARKLVDEKGGVFIVVIKWDG